MRKSQMQIHFTKNRLVIHSEEKIDSGIFSIKLFASSLSSISTEEKNYFQVDIHIT